MNLGEFKLERFWAQYEFAGPFLLCASDSESFSVKELLALEPDGKKGLEELWLGYTEAKGHPELRNEIAKLYSSISAEDVLVHVGAQEAILGFITTHCEKGDHLIVPHPRSQSPSSVAESMGCEVTHWETGFDLDIDFLRNSLRKNTKAVIINFPHNPTGYLPDRKTFEEILQIVAKAGVFLFSDEVYRCLEYDEKNRLPAACDLYENAISLGVMSKSFGLAGLRLGWIATKSKGSYKKMEVRKDFTSICPPAPSEYLSLIALRNKKKLLERNRAIVKENLHGLRSLFDQHKTTFAWTPPKAGCVAFPKLLERSSEVFCRELLEKQSLLLAPSHLFNYGDRHFRIGFGRKNFKEGLAKLESFLD